MSKDNLQSIHGGLGVTTAHVRREPFEHKRLIDLIEVQFPETRDNGIAEITFVDVMRPLLLLDIFDIAPGQFREGRNEPCDLAFLGRIVTDDDARPLLDGLLPRLLEGQIGYAAELQLALLAILVAVRSEEHTSELQSLMRISYAVFCLKKKNQSSQNPTSVYHT